MKIEGEAGHKQYRVMRDQDETGEVFGSFDTLPEAIAHTRGLRADRRYVIRDHGRKVVWPTVMNAIGEMPSSPSPSMRK